MRYFLTITLFLCCLCLKAQTVSSYVITSAGDAIMSDEGALYLSVGEPMNTELLDGEVMISQGFLQITVQGNILNNEELLTEHIRIFPNPTIDEIQLSLEGDLSEYSYSIYDALGNILTRNIPLTSSRIGFNSYTPGTYLMTIHKGSSSSKSLRIVKQ